MPKTQNNGSNSKKKSILSFKRSALEFKKESSTALKKHESDPKTTQPVTGPSRGSSGGDNVSYEEAFDQTGHGCFSYLAITCCSLIFVHSIIETTAMGFIITPAECDLKLTVPQKSMVNAAVLIGIMVTAICWGVLGDKLGRRFIMLPAVFGTVLSSFISSLCTAFYLMFLFRFLAGVMVSASSAMVLVYLSELLDNKHRDKAIATTITTAQVCFVLLPALSWIIIPRAISFKIGSLIIRPWRMFMWVWGIVGLSGAIILLFLPESPRYVYAVKGATKTVPILIRIYQRNNGKNAPPYRVKSLAETNETPAVTCKSLLQDLSEMMKAPMRRCVLLTHLCMFVTFLFANGLYMWIPDFFNSTLQFPGRLINMCALINEQYIQHSLPDIRHFSDSTEKFSEDCSKINVNWLIYPMNMVTETFACIPFITVIYLIDKRNKPKLYATIAWATSAALILSVVIPQCVLAVLFFAIGLANGSCTCVVTALAVEAFPTSLRGLATCTMFMCGQLGAVVGTSVLGLMENWACYLIFVLLAGVNAGSGIALVLLWPDTKIVRQIMESREFNY